MTAIIEPYIDKLTNNVYIQITDYLKDKTDEKLIVEHFTNRLKKKQFANFQVYYFKTLNNPDALDFSEFKQKYSLQGIDVKFINHLQQNKLAILKLISDNKLSELYFGHFAKAQINHKETVKEKNLGSFFTKVVHTFRPADYTPLDIPIRNYFKLKDESYFVAFIVVSTAYKIWATNNKERIENMKILMKKSKFDGVTDLKLLNLIFWSVADKEKGKESLL
ncbi:MAG: hypothetical protein ACYDCN_11295 [Bacteroidia bacterium]